METMTTINDIAAAIIEGGGGPYLSVVDGMRYVTYPFPETQQEEDKLTILLAKRQRAVEMEVNAAAQASQQENNTIYMKTDARRTALHTAMDMAKIQLGVDVLDKAEEIYNWLTKDL
jgi:hypothetical protein